jgi:NAD(P)-dependent dehydrogenase (short-subunit alcohol dehydrogenase family)
MSNSIEGKVVFITGAGRGMGTDIAKAALFAGCKVVATGRNTKKVAEAIGGSDDLLVVRLDVTSLLMPREESWPRSTNSAASMY